MKTFLTIVITAAITWITVSVIHGLRTGVERLWLISAIKAPGRMALTEIQTDMNAGRYDIAKAKIDVLVTTWQKFDSEPDSFRGSGIGDIMIAFSKVDTNSSSNAIPPKFTPEEVAQSLALLVREGEKGKARFAALDAVRDSAPYVSEFIRLFPRAQVNYRYFTGTGEPGFDVGVDLHERYEFRMQLPVRFDLDRVKVIGYGEPKFVIWEAASVTRGPSGLASTRLNPAGERHFGSAEWRTLVERGGDFSAIGYTMTTNRPVPGFAQREVQP